MTELSLPALFDYLQESVLTPFYMSRLEKLHTLNLERLLKGKNPYLLKAKHLEIASDLVRQAVDAFLSSQEETLFGNLMEKFAIHVAEQLYSGFKSERPSVDLEFVRRDKYYVVGIKSGIRWGNADQIAKMQDNFKRAREALRAGGVAQDIIAVNGCIYGFDSHPLKVNPDPDKIYYRYAGQDFWAFLTEQDDFYTAIIQPIDTKARERSQAFNQAHAAKVNEITAEFMARFMHNHEIDWSALVAYISQRRYNIHDSPLID